MHELIKILKHITYRIDLCRPPEVSEHYRTDSAHGVPC